jgi:hypothetical protein
LAVVVALEVPLSVTVAPTPPAAGLIVPEIEKVAGGCAVAVKFKPATLADAMVAGSEAGLKVNPVWLGVTV